LDYVLKFCFRVRHINVSTEIASLKPEFDVATQGIHQVFDVQELAYIYRKPGFFQNLTLGSFFVGLCALDTASWGNPEVICVRLRMANQK